MSPAPRKPRRAPARKPPADKPATAAAAATTPIAPDPPPVLLDEAPVPVLLDEAPVPEVAAAPTKPPPAFPGEVPLETGLSDYGMWIEMFAGREGPPLPDGERRGRIWV